MNPSGGRWKYSHGLLLPKEFVEQADDRLEEVILRLPCYEPTNLVVEWKASDLLRHLLLVGSTGAGKTTLLNKIWRELISYRSAKTGQACGLLILDCQGGNAVDHIRQLATEAGRAADVLVLSADENHFNPLGNLDSFAAIETAAAKIISATRFSGDSVSENNSYWTENTRNLILAGLLLPLVTHREATLVDVLRTIARVFLDAEWSSETKEQIKKFDEIVLLARPKLSSGISTMLEMARATLGGWGKFDSKAKSILRSCISITISPFMGVSALPYWDPRKGAEINPTDALMGKIVIVSCSAATEPETTALLSRLVKIEFYGAAQKRRSLGSNHLAGIIMDEFHYAITAGGEPRFSDISNLATLRAKGIFVIAATQGLVQLDLIVGVRCTEALLINFSSVIFMRSQETGHLYLFAERLLGYKPAKSLPTNLLDSTGDILLSLFPLMLPPEPVCPPGALALLEPHQAYVSLVSGFKTKEPIWIAPLYLPESEHAETPSYDSDLVAIRIAEARLNQGVTGLVEETYYSQKLWEIFVNTSPRQVKAIATMSQGEFKAALKSIGRTPDGLETIPPAWRQACFKLASRLRPAIRLCSLSAREGKLEVSFASFTTGATLEDILKLEARWKKSVYPTPLRPFHKRDLQWIEDKLPHLSGELSQTKTKLPPEQSL